MPLFYLDASAIVKRYCSEQGTDVVDELLVLTPTVDRFFTSYLSVLEVTAAIRRMTADHRLDVDTADALLAQFSLDTQGVLRLWPLHNDIITQAIAVVSQYLLRSADAIHLTTASLIAGSTPGDGTVMVTGDHELVAAAAAAGLTVLNPDLPGAMELLRRLRRPH